ncbi:MAG: RDD family protein [Acidobacteria bacterium]|nr:MAG: RDD family protein [Acidobacteriota bacterium]
MIASARERSLPIRTPEGVLFSLPLAGPVTRGLAWLIDVCCITAACAALTQVIVHTVGLLSPSIGTALAVLLYSGVSIGYGMALEWRLRGQTLGKRLLGLRVMDEEGLKLQPSQVVLRNLLRAVDLLPGLYLVGGAACFFSRRAQRLGDIAAGTVVVLLKGIEAPDLDQVLPRKYNSFRDTPHLAARLRQKVSPREASIALQLLLRRDELDDAARLRLCSLLAESFRRLVAFPEEATAGLTDEQYLRNVVDVCFRARDARDGQNPGGVGQ